MIGRSTCDSTANNNCYELGDDDFVQVEVFRGRLCEWVGANDDKLEILEDLCRELWMLLSHVSNGGIL